MKQKFISTTSIVAETAENIFDNAVQVTASTLVEEIVKAIPVTNAVKSIYNGIRSIQETRRATQFLIFVQECEDHSTGDILKIFRNKNNLEMGMEILNALEISYLEKHAQMIARATILYDAKELDRPNFLKYIHIIPKLTSYLLSQVEECYLRNISEKTEFRHGIAGVTDEDLTLELETYGFVNIITHPLGGKEYQATDSLNFLYEKIFQNSHGR